MTESTSEGEADAPFAAEEMALPSGIPPLPEEGFTVTDRWAWAQIVLSGSADFNARFSDDAEVCLTGARARPAPHDQPFEDAEGHMPASAEEIERIWSRRTLSPRFLNQILCCEPWRSAIPSAGIDITGARLEGGVERPISHGVILDACLLPEGLVLYGASFQSGLLLRDCTIKGMLNLCGVTCAQTVRISGCWTGPLDLSETRIEGSLWVTDCVIDGPADVMDLKVAGSFTLAGTAVHGSIEADRLDVGGTLFLRSMPYVPNFDLVNATIGGSLDLSASRFDGIVDLTNAQVGRDLRLSTREHQPPVWTGNAKLILRNAHSLALQADTEALLREGVRRTKTPKRQDFVPSDLSGFTFRTFGGRHADGADTLADAPSQVIRNWIESRKGANDRYTPAPYRAFAEALGAAGHADKASELLIAKNEHRLRARNTGLFTRFVIWFSGVISGYGQRNHRALFWYVALGFFGMAAGLWAQGWRPEVGAALPETWDAWLRASLDNAAPVVEFSPDSAGAMDRLLDGNAPDWLRSIWFAIAMLGFVVLSYLLAGISGVFDRGEK